MTIRPDRRAENTQLRALAASQNVLNRADGSAKFDMGETSVLVSVVGPVDVSHRDEKLDEATVEVVVRPAAGYPATNEKLLESILRTTFEPVILAGMMPRTLIQIVVQIMKDDGSVLAAAVNGITLALLDAGVPMKFMAAAVSCAIDKNTNAILLDPTKKELENAGSEHTFAFNNDSSASLLLSNSTGRFSQEQYFECHNTSYKAVDKVHGFMRVAIESKKQKEYQTSRNTIITGSLVTEKALIRTGTYLNDTIDNRQRFGCAFGRRNANMNVTDFRIRIDSKSVYSVPCLGESRLHHIHIVRNQMSERNSTFRLQGNHYLLVEGSYVDRIGSEGASNISAECAANRSKRDGEHYHVTLISPPELKEIIKGQKLSRKERKSYARKLAHDIYEHFGDSQEWERPIDLGQGRCILDNSVTYFRVLHWPFGQRVRQWFGLKPFDFHITLGFDPKDVHLYKGPATLDILNGYTTCTRSDLDRLSAVAGQYIEDFDFIYALFQQAIRIRYFSVALHAGLLCIHALLSKLFARRKDIREEEAPFKQRRMEGHLQV
ncbi:Exosome component 5 [Apophysomyces ossiformis]|uniref:Exosome component 5 n=1 Tax=Apophysomyces ossiformis TaxID=679940 RepID=A0A8H7BL92_9FUNG|nr:Exosome component 5 [Apophysomyces ossiformis]